MPERRSSLVEIGLQRLGCRPGRARWALGRMTGKPAASRRRHHGGCELLMAAAFDVARPEVTYAGKGAGGRRARRQRKVV